MPFQFARVAVVGAGYMGGGIAQVFAANGTDCVVADASREATYRAVAALTLQARRHKEAGLISAQACQRMLRCVRGAESVENAVRDADFIVEAVPESREIKSQVLSEISRLSRPDAVIGTNTSAMPISELAESVEHLERFLGVHWMNPPLHVPCVEVIPTSATDPRAVHAVMQLLRDSGKTPTQVADSPGFVASRLQYALLKECTRLVEEGVADPSQVDEVVRNSFGFRLPFFGPFAIADLAGLDVYAGGFASLEKAYGERMAPPRSLTERVAAGRCGLKSGAGFFEFDGSGADRIARHRDVAYARLAELKRALGEVDFKSESSDAVTQQGRRLNVD